MADGKDTNSLSYFKHQPLTTFELLQIIISIFGFALVIRSINQVSNTLHNTASQNITSQLLELDNIFIDKDNAKLWPYFHEGKSLDISEQATDYGRIISIADYHLDFFDLFYAQAMYLPELSEGTAARTAWENYIYDSFAESPVMCERINDVQSWYEPELVTKAVTPCRTIGILIEMDPSNTK